MVRSPEKVFAIIAGIFALLLGAVLLSYGIEVWTIFNTTHYRINDIGYLGIAIIIIGVAFLIASLFLGSVDRSHSADRRFQYEGRTMYCPQCGKPTEEGTKYCKYCGAKIG